MASARLARVSGHLLGAAESKSIAANATGSSQSSPAGGRRPVKVVVTGAAGNIAYSIIFMIAQGQMLGPDTPIELRLLDIPMMAEALRGVEMELVDCAFPLVTKIVSTTDPSYKPAFDGIDIALLIGAKPRGPGMERKDLLSQNAAIFAGQGQALNQYASRNVKVLVVGNPANTNCLIAQVNAPDIPKENFSAMTRLDHHRAAAQIAARLKVPVKNVKNVIIWGNHSKTQYPDVNHGFVMDYPKPGMTTTIRDAVKDDAWLDGEFMKVVQDRGAKVIEARKYSSAASAAFAAVSHMRSWVLGTPKGEWTSMAVVSDGSYGVPKGLVFSFPVLVADGKWQIVQNLKINPFSKNMMKITTDELLDEKKQALSPAAPSAGPAAAAAAKPAAAAVAK